MLHLPSNRCCFLVTNLTPLCQLNITTIRQINLKAARSRVKHNLKAVNNLIRDPKNALEHFDGLYGKVYGKEWPSMRLGLLSPKKPCAILNTYLDNDDLHQQFVEETNAIEMQRYYKKHLHHYIRTQLRDKLILNKKARKRELMAKQSDVDINTIDMESIEVSDVSDSELKGAFTTDDEGGFSSAEDLQEMFSDRRMDDDEKYFINKARVDLSLEDFVPATELIYHEELSNEMDYYDNFEQDAELVIERKVEPAFTFDSQLKIYTFPRNDWSRFDPPSQGPHKTLNYFMLDGASVLPVLALDLQMGDVCADYCAAPGGKSLAMMMTLKPKYLLSNDKSLSRLRRMKNVMRQYLPKINYVNSTLEMTNHNAATMIYPDMFDKILVDVPCSNDRHSVMTIDNNLFSSTRTSERIGLPNYQSEILKAALRSLKPKGSLVYSTCTMSPIENDGVVHRTLKQLQDNNLSYKFAIVDLIEAFRPFRGLFRFNTKFKYGQQVVPHLCSNFGPMYICKIKRLS